MAKRMLTAGKHVLQGECARLQLSVWSCGLGRGWGAPEGPSQGDAHAPEPPPMRPSPPGILLCAWLSASPACCVSCVAMCSSVVRRVQRSPLLPVSPSPFPALHMLPRLGGSIAFSLGHSWLKAFARVLLC